MSLKLKINMPSKSVGSKRPEARKHEVSSTPTSSGLPKLKLIANKVGKKKKKKDKGTKLKLKLNQPLEEGSMVKMEEETTRSSSVNGSVSAKPPRIRVKPQRTLGEGYDSEAPEVEDDPLIEQGIVIRFLNDTNLDFVHSAVDLGNYSGLNIKWITKDKAVVNVKGTLYAARLLDLPTITELFKTLDKKNLFKTLDISQILLVLRSINPHNLNMERDFEVPEEYLYQHPFYRIVGDGDIKTNKMVLRDGLLNSFEDTYRRMRPRKINHRIMEDIDRKVNDLIKLDNEAVDSHFELVKIEDLRNKKYGGNSVLASAAPTPLPSTQHTDSPQVTSGDAHGALDNGNNISQTDAMETNYDDDENEAASDLEEELARALDFDIDEASEEGEENDGEEEEDEEGEEDEDEEEGELGAETPNVKIEDEEEEDDDDDDDEEEEEDDEEEEDASDKKRTKLLEEEIKELEKTVVQHKEYVERAPNKIARKRFQNQYGILKLSLENKKRELAKIQSELDAANAKADSHLFATQSEGAPVNEDDEEDDEDDDDMGDDQDLDGLF